MSVALVASVVSLVDSIDLTVLTMYGYQRHFAVVTPRNALAVPEDIAERIRSLPDTGSVYPARPAFTVVKTIFGKMPFVVFGLPPQGRAEILQRCGLRIASGRLPRDGRPEVALSAEIARNRRLHLGDVVLEPNSEDSYSLVPVRLVGTLQGPVWLATTSESFVRAHFPVAPRALVVTSRDPDRQGALDRALERAVPRARSRVWTYRALVRDTREALSSLYLILAVVIAIIVFSIAFLTGMLANIYFTQRLPEFATLAAIGWQRRALLLRVLGETALLCTVGWAVGALATVGLLSAIKSWIMHPRGLLLEPLDVAAYRFTLPLPITITLFALVAVWLRLKRLDPVSIIERRQ